jgi:hypothetical protein
MGGKKQISIYHRDDGKKLLGQTLAKKGEMLRKKECPCRTTRRNVNNVKPIQIAADSTEIKKEVGEQQLPQHQKDDKCIISSPEWSTLEAGLLGLVEIDF